MYIVNLVATHDTPVNCRLPGDVGSRRIRCEGRTVADLVGAVDQGTTSTRFMVFDHSGSEVARNQLEHTQVLPRPGWVEHNPVEIWERASAVIMTVLSTQDLRAADLAALGITNQRETTVVWVRRTGRPYGNAIVWQDTRTDKIAAALEKDGPGDLIRRKAGLPPATYFSGGKLRWMLDNIEGLRAEAERGDAIFGTVDTLAAVEPDRRHRGRRPRHRRHQCQPHHADEPGHPRLGRRVARPLHHPRVRCCRGSRRRRHPSRTG
jgi:FGGY family of carbohydrate kinases, N-terminal domain